MFKKNMLKRKKIFKKGLFGILAVTPIITGFLINDNSQNHNLSSVSQNLQAFSNGQSFPGFVVDTSFASQGYSLLKLLDNSTENQGTESGIGIKIPNFSNSDEQAQENAKNILSTYSGLPSNIVTVGSESNIENIIWVDNTKWNTVGDNKYKIFNLGSTSTYSEYYQNNENAGDGSNVPTSLSDYKVTVSSQLPSFNQRVLTGDDGTTTTENVSEEFLDKNGILALQITVSQFSTASTGGAVQWESFYILIPGFGGNLTNNALSNNPMLPSNLYTSGVDAISDRDLNNFLQSSWQENRTSVVPNISLVSRKNDAANGILSFTSSFNFNLPDDIQFSSTFKGVTDSSISSLTPITGKNINITDTNTYFSQISYDMNFKVNGFQPSPAVSDTQVFIIVIVIIAAAVVISILGFAVTIVSRRIRFKNKM
ncbi:MAG: hypothetical protein K2I76_01280 [Malacoplasma sp.]|nr:hypothetical protein [Malacoplasma sp.]MDE5841811.1 hypothetical protein [Malacoplasma sp.]